MNSTKNKESIISKIVFENNNMLIYLKNGRILNLMLNNFPRLNNANIKALENWREIGNGEGIRWEELDEDVLIEKI